MRYISAPQRSQTVLASAVGAAVSADFNGVTVRSAWRGSASGAAAPSAVASGFRDLAPTASGLNMERIMSWIDEQLVARGIKDARLLDAMRRVPREAFVPPTSQTLAYADRALPIGSGQTISQPFMVAVMSEALRLDGAERVLEIGTGSGYQTAILAELAAHVFSIERHPALADAARATLLALGYTNVDVVVGDGTLGLADQAPFDRILVTAGAPRVPDALSQQLSPQGGRLVIPVGTPEQQWITVVVRDGDRFNESTREACVFVPLLGQDAWHE
jgi:protein-L-isoaspartate(D-aspartate) O-methyltransferase